MAVENEALASEYMTTQAVADYTGLSAKFWQELRSKGGGPGYAKPSPKVVLYRKSDIDGWIADHMRRSTFDERKPEQTEASA